MINETLWQRRLWLALFAVFASVALLLAAVDIYGVLSYSVSQRTREIGGTDGTGSAKRKRGADGVGPGTEVGSGRNRYRDQAALALSRFIDSLLFGVRGSDPLTYAAVTLLLVFAAMIACFIPAWRAAKMDPTTALRQE